MCLKCCLKQNLLNRSRKISSKDMKFLFRTYNNLYIRVKVCSVRKSNISVCCLLFGSNMNTKFQRLKIQYINAKVGDQLYWYYIPKISKNLSRLLV